MTNREAPRGFTLAESLVALLLLALVVHAAWSVTARHTRGTLELMRRGQVLEAVRTTAWSLRGELTGSRRGIDWEATEDSVSLRAFRALGTLCPDSSSPGSLLVSLDGIRAPDASKDSVLILDPTGRWRVAGIGRVSRGPPCGTSEAVRLTLDDPAVGGHVVRIFEKGSYHLSDGAFRYRRGFGGRQPLTPRVLGPEIGFIGTGTGALVALLTSDLPGRPAGWERVLRFPVGRAQ